jgi:glycosyltransferase involved in cell wall biosynthesis
VHDVRPHVRSVPARVERALLRRLYREDCAGELIAYSHLLKDELVADYGVESERVHVIPHPLDASDLRRHDVSRPPRPLVLLFGALRPNKGLPVLLAALEQLPADPGFDVVVAGAGDATTCEELTRAAERLTYFSVELGFVDRARKAELHNQASLVVMPYTEFHSFSGVLADAYSYRLPVVVSDVGSLGQTVASDGTGWVVPKGDATALSEALTRAVSAVDSESGRGGLEARIAQAAQRHDYSVVGPQYRAVMAMAVERDRICSHRRGTRRYSGITEA